MQELQGQYRVLEKQLEEQRLKQVQVQTHTLTHTNANLNNTPFITRMCSL